MDNRFKSTEISRPLASGRERTFSEQRRAFESPAWLNRILPYTKRITVAIDPSKASFLWNPLVIIEWPKIKLKKEYCFWKCNEPEGTKDQALENYKSIYSNDCSWLTALRSRFPVALIGPKLQVNTPNLWKHQQINKLKTQKTSKCNAPLQPQESHYFTQNLNLNYEFKLGEDTVFLPNLIIPNSDYTRRRPRWEWSSWLHLHYALEFNVLNTVWRVK